MAQSLLHHAVTALLCLLFAGLLAALATVLLPPAWRGPAVPVGAVIAAVVFVMWWRQPKAAANGR